MITRVKPRASSRKRFRHTSMIGVSVLMIGLTGIALLAGVLWAVIAITLPNDSTAGNPQVIVLTALPTQATGGSQNAVDTLPFTSNTSVDLQSAAPNELSSDSAGASQDVAQGTTLTDTSNTSENAAASDTSANSSSLMSIVPPVQPFSLPALDGTTVSFPNGNVTVFVATAPGCASCIAELIPLSAMQEEYSAHGLRVYAVDMFPGDTPEWLQPYVDWLSTDFGVGNIPWLFDEGGRFSRAFNVMYLDTTIILDASGREAYRDDVPSSEGMLRNAIENAFAGS